ncbi:hypothetical protein SO802_010642, partial [Lithocarpus litseifolius]
VAVIWRFGSLAALEGGFFLFSEVELIETLRGAMMTLKMLGQVLLQFDSRFLAFVFLRQLLED